MKVHKNGERSFVHIVLNETFEPLEWSFLKGAGWFSHTFAFEERSLENSVFLNI